MGPAYSAAVVAVCDDGGLYAVANIRGGAEEGEAWHRAGMREHKQQMLRRLRRRRRLAGRPTGSRAATAWPSGAAATAACSMGAAITQRPDLCRAAQIAVPLLDMVRYHRFLIARLWIPEYGDPDDADEFDWLLRLLALPPRRRRHLLPRGAADHGRGRLAGSTRCTPARWRPGCRRPRRAATTSPILLREEARAGHGQGKPVSQPGRRAGRRARLPLVAARPCSSSGLIAPNRPWDSSFGPAVNSSVLASPATPLPNRSPHRPSITIGVPVRVAERPEEVAGGRVIGVDRPLPKLPTSRAPLKRRSRSARGPGPTASSARPCGHEPPHERRRRAEHVDEAVALARRRRRAASASCLA